jgi:hypothetical protein
MNCKNPKCQNEALYGEWYCEVCISEILELEDGYETDI